MNPFKLALPSRFKFLALSLSLLYFSGFKQAEINTIQQQAEVEAIIKIPDPNQRAFYWYIHVYKTVLSNPKAVTQKLAIAKKMWPDDFIHKEAILLLTKAEIIEVQGDYEQANSNILKAIQLLEANQLQSVTEKKILCLAYIGFANHSKYTKEKEGLAYAYKGLALANDINFVSGSVFAHNQIGLLIGYAKNDNPVALNHFMQAKALLPKLPPNIRGFMREFLTSNIIKASSNSENIEDNIKYKLELLAKDNLNLDLLLVTLNNLGADYYELKQYDLAEKYLQQSVDLMEKNEARANQGIPLLKMGMIQLEKGKLSKAMEYAKMIDSWLVNHKFMGKYNVAFYQFKSQIAKANQDYEQGVFWMTKAFTEQDSLDKIVGLNNLAKLEQSDKLRVIKQELLLLEKEKALDEMMINHQNMVIFFISFIALLSIWFSASFYKKIKALKEAYNFILHSNNSLYKKKKQKDNTKNLNKKIDEALKQKIIHALTKEKVFLNPGLTLKKIATQLDSNTSYISHTINEGFGKNFNTLINEYRIKEVLQFFEEGQYQLFTIEALYKKAGFTSKASFQKAFRKNTGVTPSHYLENIALIQSE